MTDNPVWDADTHELRVMAEKCSTCIFGPNRIILASDTRKMVAQTAESEEGNIICHKTIKLFIGPGKGAVCRGFWDRYGREKPLLRLAVAWNLVRWWKEPANEDAPQCEGAG